MSLTKKYTLIIASLLLGLVIAIGLASSLIFQNSYLNIERDALNQNILRLQNIISQDMETVERASIDWATSTDTYQFAQGQNAGFSQTNLNLSIFSSIGVQLVVVLDREARLLFAESFYPHTGMKIALDDSLISRLDFPTQMYTQPFRSISRTGYMRLNDEVYFISAQPILTSEGDGPSQGILVFGRRIDDWTARRLSNRYLQEVRLVPFHRENLSAQVIGELLSPAGIYSTSLTPKSADTMTGYILLRDFSGSPLLVYETEFYRTVIRQARDSRLTLMSTLAFFGLIFLFLSNYLPRRMIFQPINRLSQGILNIGKGGSFSARLEESGNHEIGALAKTINQALNELEKSQRLQAEGEMIYHKLFEASLGGIFIETIDGRILDCNQAACQMYGYPLEEMIGMTVQELIPEEGRHQLVGITEYLQNHSDMILQTSGQRNDGQVFPAEVSIQALELTGERLAVVYVRDMTSEVHLRHRLQRYASDLEQRVAERTASLEEVNNELKSFAFSVSHDLRAPLRALQGFAAALREDYAPQLGEEGQDYSNRIVEAACWMDEMIQDLLSYSRLTREEIELIPVDLSVIVAGARNLLRGEIDSSKAVIVVEEPLENILAAPAITQQVVANLLSNAIKFSKAGHPPVIKLWTERRNGQVRLWVGDSGIGIAPEHYGRIFQVFERLHGMETYPGNGIGLAIVRKAVQRMGGQVGLESCIGEGSKFWIELKRYEVGETH